MSLFTGLSFDINKNKNEIRSWWVMKCIIKKDKNCEPMKYLIKNEV